MYAFRKFLLHFCMKSKVMTDVCEISVFGTDLLRQVNGLCQVEVRVMWLFSQSVEHQYIKSTEFLAFVISNGFNISQISKRPHAIAQNSQLMMLPNHRDDVLLTELKCCRWINWMRLYSRCARIFVNAVQNIPKPLGKVVNHSIQSINGDVALSKEKRSYIVEASSVISVLVCKQYGIETIDAVVQHLLSKIRPTVNHNRIVVPLHQSRSAKAFVTRVITVANRVVATNDGNAL